MLFSTKKETSQSLSQNHMWRHRLFFTKKETGKSLSKSYVEDISMCSL
jgi:hypothetical protein